MNFETLLKIYLAEIEEAISEKIRLSPEQIEIKLLSHYRHLYPEYYDDLVRYSVNSRLTIHEKLSDFDGALSRGRLAWIRHETNRGPR